MPDQQHEGDHNQPSAEKQVDRIERKSEQKARGEAGHDLGAGALNDATKATRLKQHESGNSGASGIGDKHGRFRSAKEIFGDAVHTPLTKQAEAKRDAEFKSKHGDPNELQGAKRAEKQEHKDHPKAPEQHNNGHENLAEKHHDGSVRLRVNADTFSAQHEQEHNRLKQEAAKTPEVQLVSAISTLTTGVSDFAGKVANSTSHAVGEQVKHLEDAIGMNPTAQKAHQFQMPDGHFHSNPKGVQRGQDVVDIGLSTTVSALKTVDQMAQHLPPGKAIQEVPNAVMAAGTAVSDTLGKVKEAVDMSFVVVDGNRTTPAEELAHNIGGLFNEGWGNLTKMATEYGQKSAGERGQEIGPLAAPMPPTELAGFIFAGKAMRSNELAKELGLTIKKTESLTSDELALHAKKLGVDISKIEKVGNPPRMPLNWEYAGKTFMFDAESNFAKKYPDIAKELDFPF